MKVYLIEWEDRGYHGVERVVFDSREKAEKWIQSMPATLVDSYDIIEAELE